MPKSPEKRNVAAASGAKAGATMLPQPPAERSQMECFEEGMRLFNARQFDQSRQLFLAASKGADRAVSHRAGLHYNYAVTLINSRDLGGAQKHLKVALEAEPTADHVLYALAACQGLTGDLQGAYENLKRAIDLQPRNRLAARQDPDFAGVADQPAFVRLLHPEKR